ncbi:hypothetical protein AMECASPLE_019785 [Ameca splendens]|uniref:SET domain-containing protein n=1 Tax=Ameca splendens TaxID=208324 RepID=A0ABV1AAW2_9TELE
MMDLPCVQWQDHVAQKWSGLDPELRETFTSLREIDDVFKCALSLANQQDLDAVQSISAGYSVKKDPEEAAKCREKGNSSFKAKDYKAAALHYSQGICFAPQSSEQLSLCYANRSAALCHLQHYQESLDDIDRALKSGYPSHLSNKLKDRRILCLNHLSRSSRIWHLSSSFCRLQQGERFPPGGFKEDNSWRGLQLEPLLFSCLSAGSLGRTSPLGMSIGSRTRCDGCNGTARSQGDVTVATLYLKLSKAGPLPVSWMFNDASSSKSQSSDGPKKKEEDTEWSSELWVVGSAVLRHMLQLRCNAQAVITLQDAGSKTSRVQSVEQIRIATAIFPTLSLLNHSCCPNTSLVFSTGTAADPCDSQESIGFNQPLLGERRQGPRVTVTVRAARVITPGEEILHCYGPHSNRMGTRERQRLLQRQYYFLCECEACSVQEEELRDSSRNESGLLCSKCKGALKENRGSGFICSLLTCGHQMSSADLNHKLQEIRLALEKAVALMEREISVEALHLLKKTRNQSGLILGESHPLQGELADATARAYASVGDWKNAATYLEQSAIATSSQYGKDSLELGQQLFKLVQLHFNGGARGPALSVIPKVRRILSLHCGPHCPELQELNAMEECLQGSTF